MLLNSIYYPRCLLVDTNLTSTSPNTDNDYIRSTILQRGNIMPDPDFYPAGMTTADLIHVGEIADPYEKFYENFEPTDSQMEEFLLENVDNLIAKYNFNNTHYMKGITWKDLTEWYREENSDVIESEYERQRNDY